MKRIGWWGILWAVLASVYCSTSHAQGPAKVPASPVTLISPWIDHHDRIEEILTRLSPAVAVNRVALERNGPRGTLDWQPAFGFGTEVELGKGLLVLENAPYRAIEELTDANGLALDAAIPIWVRSGGHLLIVGGSPSLESYWGTPFADLMGFMPDKNARHFEIRKRRAVTARGGEAKGVFIDHLHAGRLRTARTLLNANGQPLLIQNRVGRGRVTTLLSGAQGGRRRDGGEPVNEFFQSSVWEQSLETIAEAAYARPFALGDKAPREPALPLAAEDALDVRFFMISHQPYPFALAPGEAYDHANKLRRRGFTSTVYAVNGHDRPLGDRRTLEEIAAAGLWIVYYDGVRSTTPPARFWKPNAHPPRVQKISGGDGGWDIYSERFKGVVDRFLDHRDYVADLPLRAVQLIEEFVDGGTKSETLTARHKGAGMSDSPSPGDPEWIKGETLRADATYETFQAFRTSGQKLFPGLPQSTYWPGSYWSRPLAYSFRLSALEDAVDEILGPGYGYGSARRVRGPESVRWSANSGWAALRDSVSSKPHLAIYGMGRPLSKKHAQLPGLLAWRETAWTGLAHGATGLAYWALPKSDMIDGLSILHAEMERLGPWLKAPARSPAPVAIVQSWTSRGENGKGTKAGHLDRCLKDLHEALEVGFEDVDLVLEERVPQLSDQTEVLVLMDSPALSPLAVKGLVTFLDRGGRIFLDGSSATRIQPGNQPLNLKERTKRPEGLLDIPLTLGCQGVRLGRARAADEWRALLQGAGIRARVETTAAATAGSLRGNDELIHVYGLNHGKSAAAVAVDLDRRYAGRTWVELRSGNRIEAGASERTQLRGALPVESGEALIWASVSRPADRMEVTLERLGQGVRYRVRSVDAQGRPVADGYPIQLEIAQALSCEGNPIRSATLVGGVATLDWKQCSLSDSSEGVWAIEDPMTGRRYLPSD